MDTPGTPVWVPDSRLAWVRATIKSVKSKSEIEVRTENGDRLRVKSADCHLDVGMDVDLTQINDLTKLPALHEPALLTTLQQRFANETIYTYTGPILIAINPFKRLKIYGPKPMKTYMNAPLGHSLPPHAYAVADSAYKRMTENGGRNQSVLVSGESGAGKTETTKIVMEYLTEISSQGGKQSDRTISTKILQANPLLEAFGNAKTIRNDNSSRFGKLIKMQFEKAKRSLGGAQITTYLLEKARVSRQGSHERNYHIFYEMLAGGSKSQLKHWNLPPAEDCHYINQSGTYTRGDIDDVSQFKLTLQAMDVLVFTQTERDDVFNTIAAILHLGNIQFVEKSSDGSAIANGSSKTSAENCARLLQVNVAELEKVLCTRVIRVGFDDEVYAKNHNVQQAVDSRDALAMTLYERLFGWIVWRTNSAIGSALVSHHRTSSSGPTAYTKRGKSRGSNHENDYIIGCLDVFGFEVFEKNSFEQFCINYCNEQLQKEFNEFVFEIEQAEYEREGIDWEYVEFPDNSACLQMIENRPIGLLALVDEQCMYPGGNDRSLAAKLYENLPPRFESFVADHKLKIRDSFIVRHFAGDVIYTCEGFFQKNKNELRQEAVDLVVSSKDKLVSILLPPDADSAAGGADMAKYFSMVAGEGGKKRRSQMVSTLSSSSSRSQLQQKTVSSHFKSQLNHAMSTIRASDPHYIRCLKPNDDTAPLDLEPVRLVEQLRYSGVIEVIRVARAGYPSRFALEDFVQHFAILGLRPTKGKSAAFEANKLIRSKNRKAVRQVCQDIVEGAKLKHGEDYQIGDTKVFMRADTYTTLQLRKNAKILRSVLRIQRAFRRHAFRKTQLSASIRIQAMARGALLRKRVNLAELLAQKAKEEHSRESVQAWKEEATERERARTLSVAEEKTKKKKQPKLRKKSTSRSKSSSRSGQSSRRIVVDADPDDIYAILQGVFGLVRELRGHLGKVFDLLLYIVVLPILIHELATNTGVITGILALLAGALVVVSRGSPRAGRRSRKSVKFSARDIGVVRDGLDEEGRRSTRKSLRLYRRSRSNRSTPPEALDTVPPLGAGMKRVRTRASRRKSGRRSTSRDLGSERRSRAYDSQTSDSESYFPPVTAHTSARLAALGSTNGSTMTSGSSRRSRRRSKLVSKVARIGSILHGTSHKVRPKRDSRRVSKRQTHSELDDMSLSDYMLDSVSVQS